MNILITGATGFLGSNLTNYFLDKGHNVIVVKRSFDATHRIDNRLKDLTIYDIDKTGLEEPFKNDRIDCIINTAALYGRNKEPINLIIDANITFPTTLLENAVKYSVPAFINTGTGLPKFLSPYALTKVQFVEFGQYYANQEAIKFINMQCEHFYGPGDDQTKFTAYVIDSCLKNVEELKLTEGRQKRDFIYMADLLEAFNTVVNSVSEMETYYESYEVGSGSSVTIREFVEKVHKYTDSRTKLLFGAVPTRKNEPAENIANIHKIKQLGWKPMYSIDDGIIDTINHNKILEEIKS